VYASSLSGINAADTLLTARADNIANADTPNFTSWVVQLTAQPLRGVSATVEKAAEPGVDLADESVGLITGSLLYKANARALETSAETDKSLLDVVA